MVDITYRTLGPWGSGKGANLQPAEVDTNFWNVAEAIVALQTNPAQPVGIASITVSGTQMWITLTDSTVLGPYTLPVLTFRWRGEWEPNADYVALDVVTVFQTGIFMCQVSHTSGATFDIDQEIGGTLVWLQLFGSVDATLSGLSDVDVNDPMVGGELLQWSYEANKWLTFVAGTMVYEDTDNVTITGGSITGMPAPTAPGDVATKAYVDALPAGMTSPPGTMMSNASTASGPAIANTLTTYLDFVLGTSAVGTLLYRSSAGWVALAPGVSGQFLKTQGAGLDPQWAPGGSGVTSVSAGTGITTGGSAIVATGTVSLDVIPDRNFLSNISGGSAAPTPHTLSAFLDVVLSNARGSILTRTIGGWVSLAPGLIGQVLTAQGTSADLTWTSPAGGGTVTSINAGTGISTGGAPITGSGSVSLAAVASNTVLANITAGSAAPAPATLTALLDAILGSTQGSLMYRAASAWLALSPGTSGQVLTSGGAAANPAWAAASSGAPIASLNMLANLTGGTATATGQTVSAVLDAVFSSARGAILFRGATGWAALAPGTSGDVLTTGGSAANPSWAPATGTGSPPGGLSGQVQFISAGAFGGFTVSGDATLNTSTGMLTLATANSNVGTFQGLTINAKGLVIAAVNQGYITGNQTITLSGDLAGSGSTSIAATVTGLQGQPVSATVPTSSQVLQWSGTAWEPATLSGGGSVSITAGTGITATPSPITGTGSVALTVPVSAVNGGTAQTTWAQGDLLYASAANTLSKLPKDAGGTRYLSNTGTTNNPAWAQVSLANGVTGTLLTTLGGTGQVSWTQGDVPYYQAGTALSKLAKDTNATRYISNTGTSNSPAWAQINLANGVTSTLPIGNGGTNATTAAAALTSLGAFPAAGGTISGATTINATLSSYVAGQTVANIDTNGATNLILGDTGSVAGSGGTIIFGASGSSWKFAAIKGFAASGTGNSQGRLYISTRRTTSDATLTQTAMFNEDGSTFNTSGSWSTFSERGLKQDIAPYTTGLDALVKLSPVQFRYRPGTPFAGSEPSAVLQGLIVDEVLPHIPEMCGSVQLPFGGEDATTRVATLNPTALIYVLINAVKELAVEHGQLAARLAALEAHQIEARR